MTALKHDATRGRKGSTDVSGDGIGWDDDDDVVRFVPEHVESSEL